MARPNGMGGWELTDEDVAEIMTASFGEDDSTIAENIVLGEE